ncbi:MAG: efflux RND transporter periplasmic adaptor subunit [Chitinivibrionales bacterium]|nr:efflux RND transporter periplasmic adaptor subunit [Chitinivibrionales bacterium]
MKFLSIRTIIIGALCLMALAAAGCQKDKKAHRAVGGAAADSAAVKVVVADVNEIPFEDWGSYSADLRGVEDANLSAPLQGGRVNSIKAVGTAVKAGQALCDIDTIKYQAALQAAQAQVELTKGDLDRAQVNVEKGSLGQSALSAANLAYQNARMMQATAQRAYEDCRCQAPFDGIMVSRAIDRFQTVAPGMPTVRLSRVDQLEAVIAIPETEAFSFSEGMKTEFRLLQGAGRAYEGRLSSLDRAVDSRSRTVTARIVINNRDGSLRPGMIGRARILRRTYTKAVVIPATAMLRLQNGIAVMTVENGIARQREVTVGAATQDSVLIASGLQSGDKLIVTGAFQVSNGTKVTY